MVLKITVSTGTKIGICSVLVGVAAGYGAIVFRYLIYWFSILFFEGTAGPLAWMGEYRIMALPALGALCVGLLTWFGARESKGHGVPVVLEAVATKGGRIRPRVSVITSLASSICIGSGGSAGREGPIVQIGAAVGSTVGQVLKMPANVTRTLVAAGAAAGISGTFNAPIAGVFFGLEVILRRFTQRTFGSLVLASVVANVICRIHLGDAPAFNIPQFEFRSVRQLPLYVLFGALCGLYAVGYTRILYWIEDRFDAIRRIPPYLVPVTGGILMGIIAYYLPETMDFRPPGSPPDGVVIERISETELSPHPLTDSTPASSPREHLHPEFENAYSTTVGAIKDGHILKNEEREFLRDDAGNPIRQRYIKIDGRRNLILFLLLLSVVKVFATAFTLGAGGSGGVFAPGLYIGSTFGAAYGLICQSIFPDIEPGKYAIVGMAAMFAGFARAPISAIIMLFEMTDDYYLILPLMLGVVTSTVVAAKIRYPTIYTESLLRRGIDVDAIASATTLELTSVSSVMSSDLPTISFTEPMNQIVDRLTEGESSLLVMNAQNKLLGVLTFTDLKETVHERVFDVPIIAEDLVRRMPITIAPDATLSEAMTLFALHHISTLPVVNDDEPGVVIGVLRRRDVIAAYDEAMRSRASDQ
jgi:CIC family chloride channel protein